MIWPSIQFELSRPWWLLALLALPVLAWFYRRSLVDLARWQRRISLGVRAAVVALLVLAMAGLNVLRPTREQFVVFAVDQSQSLGDDAKKAADEYVSKAIARAGSDRYAVLPFAATPGKLRTGDAAKLPASSAEPDADRPIDRLGTDLAAALEVASAAVPPFYVPKIVVLSDGNATAGDALHAAAGLRGRVEVSTVPLPVRDDPEVQISAVNVPAQVQQNEGFRVEVVVDSNHDDDAGKVEVYRGDVKAADQPVKLKKGENRLTLSQTIEQGGLTPITARVVGCRDTLLDNNSDFGLVFTAGKPRVLLADSDVEQARPLSWALEEQELQVDVRPPQGIPETLAELQNYDLIILSNVPATALTGRQMQSVRSYVQDLGGGLVMLGGDQSFGLGGYYKTTLEEILPVRSDFEKEKEKPSLAMMLVVDKSGSMGGEKIEMAKEAARAAVELLGPSDQVGVLAFDGDNFWISELHPCNDKGYVLDRIAGLAEHIRAAERAAVAKLKHVIILTDGVSEPGDFQGIAEAMASERITVTTVAMGSDADQSLLEEIAQVGGGRYYLADDPGQVPQIFAKETVTASKSAINEQPFTPTVVRPSQVLADVGVEEAPFLLGYVITRPKPTAEVILATENGDPLLAWWRYGLGMSVAFTSDAKARWGAEWLSLPQFGQFWADVARHTPRKAEAKGTVVQVDRKGARTTVTLDAIEPSGKFLNRAETELTLIDPGLGTRTLEMAQTAPGRYQAQFDAPRAGQYQLQFSQSRDGQALGRQSRGLAVGYPDELRLRPANADLLRSIAETTAGRHDLKAEDVFAPPDRTAPRTTALWPYLLGLAGLLFVLDVALRRVDLTLIFRPVRRFSRSTGAA